MTNPTPPPPTQGWLSSTDDSAASEPLDASYLDIGGKEPPPMKTLIYNPDVRILIAHGNKQYDVSADIVAVSVQRVENSVSSAVFRLTNKRESANKEGSGRYTPLFAPMDRVAIFFKRIEWVQVFSGYLDSVPLVQLYPGTVEFRASCTLKRLLHTWWDPGLLPSANLMNQRLNDANEADGMEGMQTDSGLGSTLRKLLVQVGNWDSKNIHIQRFPMGYYSYMKSQLNQYKGTEEAVEKFRRMLLGDDTSGGVGPAAGRQVGVNKGGYVLTMAERKLEVIRAVDEMGLGIDTKDLGLGQAVAVASKGGSDEKDQPAWSGHGELGVNYSESAIKNDAAVHCFMTIQVESNWLMYANNAVPESLKFPHDAVGSDFDSVGLYQQRPTWGTVDQRMNARESTGMFLNALNKLDWRNMDRGTACQAVQRSAFPGKYSLVEDIALEEVRMLRTATGTGQGAPGQGGGITSIIPSLGKGPLAAAPPAITAGLPGGGSLPGIPTTNGAPSAAAAGTLIGRPKFDTQGAINYGMSRLGTPYVYGAAGPAAFDCSSFTQWCYKAIGIDIGRDTNEQRRRGTKITMAQAVPGDLLQPADGGHVVMWLGGGQILHAPQSGDVVKVSPLYFEPASVLHFPPAEYGGPGAAPFDPMPAVPGAVPGTVAQGANGGTVSTGSNEPIARNLFSYQFEPGRFISYISKLFGGGDGVSGSPPEAAFINDEPIIQTVVALCTASMRKFQSMPNGDFSAYYPDYFGLDGKDAVLDLEDIEMKNVNINWNDDALATHVYVAGSSNPRGASQGTIGWLNTKGIATVENNWLFKRMAAVAPQVRGSEFRSGSDLMRRYGVRPLTQDMPAIQNGAMEFLMAMQIFMTKWAEQYSTQVEFAFMPELYPGMRINLVGHKLQVYVAAVTHSGDFENGFTTSATIMAPSTPDIRRIATTVDNLVRTGADFIAQGMQWFFGGG